MSVNTAHANNGVLIHSGEGILLFSDNVSMDISHNDNTMFKGTKQGRIYLTTHRMIFNNKIMTDHLKSFSFPFIMMNEVELEQPVFGANYIKGIIRAQVNGNWQGEAKFKLLFKHGGAIDFGSAMLHAAKLAQRNAGNAPPPPYTPPNGGWYQAPPPAYTPNPQGYYGWLPNTQNFPNSPPSNSVFMTDNPPPYPGIVPNYNNAQPQYPSPSYPNNAPYNTVGAQTGAIGGGSNYSGTAPTLPPPPSYFQGGATGHPGYPSVLVPNYPPMMGQPGYPNIPQNYPNNQPGYPNGFAGIPLNGSASNFVSGPTTSNYPQVPSAMGIPQPNTKETEAAQSAYYDPNSPQTAYVPPPAYYEPPPSYQSLNKKQD